MRPFYLNSELKKATQFNFGGSHLCLEIRPTNDVKNDKKERKIIILMQAQTIVCYS